MTVSPSVDTTPTTDAPSSPRILLNTVETRTCVGLSVRCLSNSEPKARTRARSPFHRPTRRNPTTQQESHSIAPWQTHRNPRRAYYVRILSVANRPQQIGHP